MFLIMQSKLFHFNSQLIETLCYALVKKSFHVINIIKFVVLFHF